jgi:hypothetical protein
MNGQLCLPAPKLTPQDVFNKAWQAFVVEKKPASFDPDINSGAGVAVPRC